MLESDPWAATGVQEGDILVGKYRAERILGVGGMGVVVSARHLQLDERVAIKFLLPHLFADQEAVGRFLREARAAVKIKSEHVARVFDVGTLPNGAPYIVMEFLDGSDLTAWLERRGAMSVEQAVDFVLQACVALADAHRIGIVHRDLKPANLFCIRRSDGQLTIKVLDFGISKVTDVTGSDPRLSVTKTSAAMGSPLYMSPEQMRSSRDVDLTTDIWALGIILFELLVGKTPFDGASLPEVAVKVATQPPPPIRSLRRDVPTGVEAVITRCLSKDARARYRTVGELAAALVEFGSSQSRASLDRVSRILQTAGAPFASAPSLSPWPDLAPSYPQAETTAPVGRTATGGTPGKRAIAVVGGAVGIALVIITALLMARRAAVVSSRPAPPSPPVIVSGGLPEDRQQILAPTNEGTASISKMATPVPRLPPSTSAPSGVTLGTAARTGPPAARHVTRPEVSGASPPHHTPSAETSSTPVVNCTPPYFIDPAGHRQYKPECL
ncbi:MAG: protein kinase [Myxococcota bacterium]|nr:protein kinase [Myxococcota bacterium]